MKNSKKLLLSTIILPFALSSANVFANDAKHNKDFEQHGAPHHQDFEHHGKKGHHGDRCMEPGLNFSIIKKLDLTSAQEDQIKALHKADRDEMRKNSAQWVEKMQAYNAQVDKLVLASKFDETAANKLAKEFIDQQAASRISMRVSMMKQEQQMFNVLTAEQKAKFKTLKAERSAKCKADFEAHTKNRPTNKAEMAK